MTAFATSPRASAQLPAPRQLGPDDVPEAVAARFENRFIQALPADRREGPGVRRVSHAAYSRVLPTPVRAPRLVAWSPEVASLLGWRSAPDDATRALLGEVLGGNALLPGMRPWAMRYGGHQFGTWAGQLGDGRAISLGELVAADGASWELQLKGAGPTPYSRRADGRAVLRSSLREFLTSEAMHHLGVPTTRALSLVVTGEGVVRDMFYDGRPQVEPGAIVCRVAPTFIRLGNFELLAAEEEPELLAHLVRFTIATHFPGLSSDVEDPAAVVAFFAEVCRRTAVMIAHWHRVGFVHGVMNTDNLSVLGLTIDYGPYGFLNAFDTAFTPNTTDAERRRYRFGNQPRIAHWNLSRFAESLVPLVGDPAPLGAALDAFADVQWLALRQMYADKLGYALRSGEAGAADDARVEALLTLLGATETDYTLFFRGLSALAAAPPPTAPDALTDALTDAQAARLDGPLLAPVRAAFYDEDHAQTVAAPLAGWLRGWLVRLAEEDTAPAAHAARMDAHNPLYLPRNHLAQEAIDAATGGDFAPLERLLAVLRRPYTAQAGAEHVAARQPAWARDKPGCSMLSCSS